MKHKKILFGRPKKKKATELPDQLEIIGLSHEGRGIAKHGGKTIFVSGALPGETVRFKIDKEHRRFDEAHCTEILTASEHRTDAHCEHYGTCGGCDFQHLEHDSQITNKETLVVDQLQRLGKLIPESIETPICSDPWHYRRSSRVGINQRQMDGQAIVGYRRRASNKLTPINNCPVLAPSLNKLLQALPQVLETADNFKDITHAELTNGDSQGSLTLRVKRNLSSDLAQQLDQMARNENFRVYLDDGKKITALNEPAELNYSIPDFNIQLNFLPGDFLQVNSAVNLKMISRAVEWLELNKSDRLLDLFCGIGNFTLPAASLCSNVVGVEGVQEMVARATSNAQLNKLTNCDFYRADLTKDLRALPWFKQGFSKVILDPPRTGASEVIEQLQNYNAEKVLYISCNPSALARDGALLAEQGYKLSRFCVMDMFPQTSHVESMALFEK